MDRFPDFVIDTRAKKHGSPWFGRPSNVILKIRKNGAYSSSLHPIHIHPLIDQLTPRSGKSPLDLSTTRKNEMTNSKTYVPRFSIPDIAAVLVVFAAYVSEIHPACDAVPMIDDQDFDQN